MSAGCEIFLGSSDHRGGSGFEATLFMVEPDCVDEYCLSLFRFDSSGTRPDDFRLVSNAGLSPACQEEIRCSSISNRGVKGVITLCF